MRGQPVIRLVSLAPSAATGPSPGCLYVAHSLKQSGFAVEYTDCEYAADYDAFAVVLNRLLFANVDLVGFSCMSDCIPYLEAALADIGYPSGAFAPTIIGGPGVTLAGPQLIDVLPVNGFAFGEGETAGPTLARAVIQGLSNVPSDVRMTPRGTMFSVGQPCRKSIDNYHPSYDVIGDGQQYSRISVSTARGCPFQCTFCSARKLWDGTFRQRSLDTVIDDIQEVRARFPHCWISLSDDSFSVSRQRVLDFCTAVTLFPERLQFACLLRVDAVDEELMLQLSRAGCTGVYFGLESASPRCLSLLGKKFDPRCAEDVVRNALKYFDVTVSFMWGMPFETWDDFQSTVAACVSLKAAGATVQMHQLSPQPKTMLYDEFAQLVDFSPDLVSDIAHPPNKRVPDRVLEVIRRRSELYAGYGFYRSPDLERKRALVQQLSGPAWCRS